MRKKGKGEQGISSLEYAFLASLIAVAILASVLAVRAAVTTTYDRIADEVTQHTSGS